MKVITQYYDTYKQSKYKNHIYSVAVIRYKLGSKFHDFCICSIVQTLT